MPVIIGLKLMIRDLNSEDFNGQRSTTSAEGPAQRTTNGPSAGGVDNKFGFYINSQIHSKLIWVTGSGDDAGLGLVSGTEATFGF